MPKIRKFEKIENFSVFQGFDWDTNLAYEDKQGQNQIYDFKDINIFYGRNYSGKTSLSKIIQCLEKKVLPLNYSNPSFIVQCESNSFDQSKISSFNHPIYVYNSDFVKENLRFIHNENDHIESFSVTLGAENQQIKEKINELKNQLGSQLENAESGLYLSKKTKQESIADTETQKIHKSKFLENQLRNKATTASNSIKNRHQIFGDIRYDITKLKNDIETVIKPIYRPLSESEESDCHQIIRLAPKDNPPNLNTFTLNLNSFFSAVASIVTTVVCETSKIKKLIENSNLNSWVQTGLELHECLSECAFCGNEVSQNRINQLRQHFDEESKKLQNRITDGINQLNSTKMQLSIKFNFLDYYETYHSELDSLKNEFESLCKIQSSSIDDLIRQLEAKKQSLFLPLEFHPPKDYFTDLLNILNKIEAIRQDCIQYTSNLSTNQKECRNKLRLCEVYKFSKEIGYELQITELACLEELLEMRRTELNDISVSISRLTSEITTEEKKLKSETEACRKINNILNNDFGHPHLTLEAIEASEHGNKNVKFEIQRDGIRAYNLSEGECSLIAFCYFLTIVEDALENNKQPIIWIDDPICSLDSNHIFFIFSLIEEKICKSKKYKQLFISTHNLEFLKYLRRITGAEQDRSIGNISEKKRLTSYYLIQRTNKNSTIKQMPLYMSKYLTEFNYLFDQIHKCATLNQIDDTNYHLFYNFGNNARKFLEIYTFYKFPCPTYTNYLEKFWGGELITTLTDRVHNEYSHMCGVLERGESILDQPEMQKTAQVIINKVKEDKEQYEALLESIGVKSLVDPVLSANQ